MNSSERKSFGKFLETLKDDDERPNDCNFNYDELRELGKEFLENFRGGRANLSLENDTSQEDVEPQVINGIASPEYRSPSSASQQSSTYGQLLAAQRFVEQHLKTKPQLPSNQEVEDLLAKLSPLRAELKQLQQVKYTATVELEQLKQR